MFESKIKDIETSYRKLAVESISCEIAFDYFKEQFSGTSSFIFEAKPIRRNLGPKERFKYSIEEIQELQSHLNLYGLRGFDLVQGKINIPNTVYSGSYGARRELTV